MIIVLFFLFIFTSGFWLSRMGKPYSSLTITNHKLIGLGMGVYLAMYVYRLVQAGQLSTIGIAAVIFTVILFLGLAATGGLLSAEKSIPSALSSVHKYIPYLTFGSTIVSIYLLSFDR